MIKIAFDNQIFLEQRYGGISRYYCELYKSLNEYSLIEVKIFTTLHFNKHLADLKLKNNLYIPTTTNTFGFNKLIHTISDLVSSNEIKRFKPNIVHKTFFYPSKRYECPEVITIYDMIHEKFSQNKEFIESKKQAIKNARHIISISESTKSDLIEIYNVPESKISVVYFGVASNFIKGQDYKSLLSRAPKLVFVGRRNGYKNFGAFIEAFARSSFLTENFQIVVFGGGQFNQNELNLIQNLGIDKNIVKRDGTDLDLKQLLEDSVAMVYPSQYEGFGLPILEAMGMGCLVFTSNKSSMPEVGGDYAFYFDPSSIDSMKNTLESKLMNISTLSTSIQKEAIEWAKNFNWKKCADQTVAVYRSLL